MSKSLFDLPMTTDEFYSKDTNIDFIRELLWTTLKKEYLSKLIDIPYDNVLISYNPFDQCIKGCDKHYGCKYCVVQHFFGYRIKIYYRLIIPYLHKTFICSINRITGHVQII